MSEPRPFASLSSGLLARKGAAKPAMRAQAFGQIGASLDDLGWDDMGDLPQAQPLAEHEHVPSSIAALTPSPRAVEQQPDVPEVPVIAEQPSVREQQRAIAEELGAEAEADEVAPDPVQSQPAPSLRYPAKRRRSPPATRRRSPCASIRNGISSFGSLVPSAAARPADRHRRARRDPQDHPEIDALADQLPAKMRARS